MNLTMLTWSGLVGIAGAFGALVRYAIGRAMVNFTASTFPWTTLLINVTGAFLIGLISALTTREIVNTLTQTVLATGFLGGYTTFSTMSWEGVQLLRAKPRRQGILYLCGNVVPGLLAAYLGLLVGGWL